MSISRSRTSSISCAAFAAGLAYSAALKNDAAAFDSAFFGELDTTWLVATTKSMASAGLLVALAALLMSIVSSPRARLSLPALLMTAATFLGSIIAASVAPDGAARHLQAMLMTLFVLLGFAHFSSRLGSVRAAEITIGAIIFIGVILISLNIQMIASGSGFTAMNPRLFGTTTHPNFLGAQMALLTLCFASAFVRRSGRPTRFALFIASLLAVYLMFQSGSRAAMLSVAVGAFVMFSARRVTRKKTLYLSCAAVASSIIVFALTTDLSTLDRGASGFDNRSHAWASMLEDVASNPVLGLGESGGASESSYLRVTVLYGVPVAILWLVAVSLGARRLFKEAKTDSSGYSAVLLALLVALLVGGLFEGYLADVWSFPRLMLLACLAFAAVRNIPPNSVDRANA